MRSLLMIVPALLLAGCAVAPPDLNPHTAAETSSRTIFRGPTAAGRAFVEGPLVYDDVQCSYRLLAFAEPEQDLRFQILVYMAPTITLLQDSRWIYVSAEDSDGQIFDGEPTTEMVEGKLHTSRLLLKTTRSYLEQKAHSGVEIIFHGDPGGKRKIFIRGFHIAGFLKATTDYLPRKAK